MGFSPWLGEKKSSTAINMIIKSELFIKKEDINKKYYIRFFYNNDITETCSINYLLNKASSSKNFKEKLYWVSKNHPELFIWNIIIEYIV